MPPPTLYECQSYFKRIMDSALAQNNSELLVDAAKWREHENKKLASLNNAKQSEMFYMNCVLVFISCFYIVILRVFIYSASVLQTGDFIKVLPILFDKLNLSYKTTCCIRLLWLCFRGGLIKQGVLNKVVCVCVCVCTIYVLCVI